MSAVPSTCRGKPSAAMVYVIARPTASVVVTWLGATRRSTGYSGASTR